MFLYQGTERDCFDSKGRQYDDINSLTELVMSTLGYDKHADDEDDDTGNNFVQVRNCVIIFNHQDILPTPVPSLSDVSKLLFPSLKNDQLPKIFMEITTPPPDLMA